jgi:dihydrofolate reductase
VDQEIVIIAAAAENGVIGRDKRLPWSIREDLARFKQLTAGFPCIMGRKTWESLPLKPLPGRINVVISSTLTALPGAAVCPGLREGLAFCKNHEKIFIIGGASIYREAMQFACRIELTRVRGAYEGDTYFPEIDPGIWQEAGVIDRGEYSFITLVRKK